MRYILLTIMLFLTSVVFGQKELARINKKTEIQIQTSAICEMCKYTLEKDLAFEKGIKKTTLNLDDKVISVVYNPKNTDAQTIRKRITLIGYHADTLMRDKTAYENLPMCCKDGSHGTPVPQVPLNKKGGN